MSYEADKEPSGSHKRKRTEGDGVETNGIENAVEGIDDLGGEMVEEEGFNKDDDLLLEDLINGADGLPPGGPDVVDVDSDFGVVFAAGDDGGAGAGDGFDNNDAYDDTSQIDLMAREILEDSSQSQGTGYGPGRKKPRRHYAPPAASKGAAAVKGSDDSGSSDDNVEEDEEVEVLEEEDEEDDDDDDDAPEVVGGKGVRTTRTKRNHAEDEEEEEEDDDDDDGDDGDAEDEGDEGDDGDAKGFRALGSKGLFPARAGKGVGGKGKVKAGDDDDDDDSDDDEEEEGEGDEEEEVEEDEGDKGGDEGEGKEHTLTRARMDRYLDVDAKIGLLTRAVRQFDAQSQVSTLLTSALLQLANTRADFAAEVEREIEHAKEEDYDSDDETEEKVELPEEETMEGWLESADPADFDALRATFLKELLQMPFKAKLNGERCTVVQAVGGDSMLVRQNGESFIAAATALSGAKGRNGAILAEWKQNRDVFKQLPGTHWL